MSMKATHLFRDLYVTDKSQTSSKSLVMHPKFWKGGLVGPLVLKNGPTTENMGLITLVNYNSFKCRIDPTLNTGIWSQVIAKNADKYNICRKATRLRSGCIFPNYNRVAHKRGKKPLI